MGLGIPSYGLLRIVNWKHYEVSKILTKVVYLFIGYTIFSCILVKLQLQVVLSTSWSFFNWTKWLRFKTVIYLKLTKRIQTSSQIFWKHFCWNWSIVLHRWFGYLMSELHFSCSIKTVLAFDLNLLCWCVFPKWVEFHAKFEYKLSGAPWYEQ